MPAFFYALSDAFSIHPNSKSIIINLYIFEKAKDLTFSAIENSF